MCVHGCSTVPPRSTLAQCLLCAVLHMFVRKERESDGSVARLH